MDLPHVFKRIFQLIYAVLLIGFFGTIAVSGTYGAFYAPPDGSLGAEQPAPESAEGCFVRFRALDTALVQTAHDHYRSPFAADGARSWQQWRVAFEGRLGALQAQCRKQTSAADDLARDLRQLAVSHDHALTELRSRGRSSSRRLDERLGR